MKGRLTIALIATLLATFAAQAQTTYRWVDPATGRTIFSDQPPPPGVKQASKREAPESSEDSPTSYATRIAMEKFPVILYTSADCTDHCAKGRELLNGRGVPFQEKMVQGGTPEIEELKKLTGGEAFVPVIAVGGQHMKGFAPTSWNNLLDLAGYPKAAAFGSKPINPLAQ